MGRLSREIKFRGKRIDNGEWTTGDLVQLLGKQGWGRKFIVDNRFGACIDSDGSFVNTEAPFVNEVDPESVGQYTGLKDRNGKEIYEGDFLRMPPKEKWDETNFVGFEVFYHDNDCADNHVGFQMNRCHFYGSLAGYSMLAKFLPKYTKNMEIFGNIYENKELIAHDKDN